MNVYIFWFGNVEIGKSMTDKWNEISKIIPDHKIVLGPSDEDHEYLLKNYEYYKVAFKQKRYVQMSDIWRLYKLSQTGGLYIDSYTNVNHNKMNTWLNEIHGKAKNIYYREDKSYVNLSMVYIHNPNEEAINLTLARYKKYENIDNLLNIELLPLQFTYSLLKLNRMMCGYEKSENDYDVFLPLNIIDPNLEENIIYANFQSSWHKNKDKALKRWKKAFQNYDHHKHKTFLIGIYMFFFIKNIRFLYFILPPSIYKKRCHSLLIKI